MFLDEAIEELKFALKGKRLINVCVGISFTASMLSDGNLGIAHTILDGDNSLGGELMGMELEEIVTSLKNSSIERGITLSILNAVNNPTSYEEGDPLEILEGNKLCVFGYSPKVDTSKFSSIIVYDFSATEMRNLGRAIVKPFSTFSSESCDSAIIFASALVNGQIDKILKGVSSNHLVLEGISSIYAPKTLKSYGFDFIGKVISIDKVKVLRIICEGGNPGKLSVYTKKIYTKL